MNFKNDHDTKKYMEHLTEIEHTDDKKAFLDVLAELWEKYPDYRFGQLFKHITGELPGNSYFLPDGVFYESLKKNVDEGFRGIDKIVRSGNAEREWTGLKRNKKQEEIKK